MTNLLMEQLVLIDTRRCSRPSTGDRERQILYGVTYLWNLKKLNSDSRVLATRCRGWETWVDTGQRVQTSSYKTAKFWGI